MPEIVTMAPSRAAMRWIIFEATVFRWIVRRRADDAVGEAAAAAFVVEQDRMRYRRCRRVFAARRDHHVDLVGRQHLQRALEGRLGQKMGIAANEQRPGGAPACCR